MNWAALRYHYHLISRMTNHKVLVIQNQLLAFPGQWPGSPWAEWIFCWVSSLGCCCPLTWSMNLCLLPSLWPSQGWGRFREWGAGIGAAGLGHNMRGKADRLGGEWESMTIHLLIPPPYLPLPCPIAAFLALAPGFSQKNCPFGLFMLSAYSRFPQTPPNHFSLISLLYSLGIFAFSFQSDCSHLHPQMFWFLHAHPNSA